MDIFRIKMDGGHVSSTNTIDSATNLNGGLRNFQASKINFNHAELASTDVSIVSTSQLVRYNTERALKQATGT